MGVLLIWRQNYAACDKPQSLGQFAPIRSSSRQLIIVDLEVTVAAIGLFFGSDDGNTEHVASLIRQTLGEDNVDLYDIADVTQLEFSHYNSIILGIPTWDFGQIQSDWEEFWGDIEDVDFSGKTVALFGLGDQFGYGDYFLDAMGMLHDIVSNNGAAIIGHWSTQGYDYEASKAEVEGKNLFVGLAIDEDQQEELTESRVVEWCEQIASGLM